jgi:glutaminyl-tRNA synthetase
MMTLNGLRRRGFTAEAINHFCDLIGVSRADQTIKCVRNLRVCERECAIV